MVVWNVQDVFEYKRWPKSKKGKILTPDVCPSNTRTTGNAKIWFLKKTLTWRNKGAKKRSFCDYLCDPLSSISPQFPLKRFCFSRCSRKRTFSESFCSGSCSRWVDPLRQQPLKRLCPSSRTWLALSPTGIDWTSIFSPIASFTLTLSNSFNFVHEYYNKFVYKFSSYIHHSRS